METLFALIKKKLYFLNHVIVLQSHVYKRYVFVLYKKREYPQQQQQQQQMGDPDCNWTNRFNSIIKQ